MKRVFLIFLINFNLNTQAQEIKIIKGSKSIPTEINLMFQSIQYPSPTKESFQILINHAYTLETYSKLVTKEEYFFTAKSEIYKTLLKMGNYTKNVVGPEDLKKLREARKKSFDPFINWLIGSLITDLDSIFTSNGYSNYLLEKDNIKVQRPETKKVIKKLSILSKIYSLISIDNPDLSKNEINDAMLDALKNVEEALFLIASETRFEALPKIISESKDLRTFSIEDYKISSEGMAKKAKTVEEILDGAENLEQEAEIPNLPKPSNENWIEEDSSPLDLKKLPKPTDDSDWLQDI